MESKKLKVTTATDNHNIMDCIKGKIKNTNDLAGVWVEPLTGKHKNYKTILNNNDDNKEIKFYWLNLSNKGKKNGLNEFLKQFFNSIEISEAMIFLNNGAIHLLSSDNNVKICEYYESEEGDTYYKQSSSAYFREKKSKNTTTTEVTLLTYYNEESIPIFFRIVPNSNSNKQG